MQDKEIVIVGAGFAGLDAAAELAGKRGVHVTLIDRHNFHTFQPLLYQVATSNLEPAEVCPNIRENFGRDPNVRVLLGDMSGMDRERSVIEVDGETISYDYLLLAIGGRTTFFGNEEWRNTVHGIKGLSDALKVRNSLLASFEKAEKETDPEKKRQLLTTVIVGGGPTGVELAGAVSELCGRVMKGEFENVDPTQARVVLIEALPQLMSGMPSSLGEYSKKILEEKGVEVVLGSRVLELEREEVRTEDATYPAATIIWAAGVEGYEMAPGISPYVTKKGTIMVRPDLRLQDVDNVFCAGDMAHLEQDGKPLPGLAAVAKQQGRHAAKNILRLIEGDDTRPFHYKNKGSMAVIGRKAAVANLFGRVPLKGFTAWLSWLFIHLMFLLGFRNRAVVMIRWLWSYLGWNNGARVLLPDYS